MSFFSKQIPANKPQQVFYYAGWNMVAAAFLVNSISVGFFFYSYGVFLKVLSLEFSASRLEISMGLTLSHVVGSFLAPLLGQAIDKYPLRNIMSLGTISVVSGFIAMSMAQSLLQFYLAIGIFMAIGTSAMGMQSSVKLVANWFIRKRGTAMGIATMGTSLAGILMPPVSTALVEAIGWRGTFLAFGALTFFIILPLVRLIVICRPEDIGLLPDGEQPPKADKKLTTSASQHTDPPQLPASPSPETFKILDAIRSFKFWNLVVVFGVMHGTLGAILIHLVAFATDQGFSTYDAAYYLSLSAMTGIFSKLIFGWLTDHFDIRLPVFLAIGFMAMGISVMATTPDHFHLAIAILVFGVGAGGVAPLRNAILAKAYGRMKVASASGLMRLFTLPLVILGAPLTGWIFDTQGSYLNAFYLLLASLLVSAIFTLFMKFKDVDKAGF